MRRSAVTAVASGQGGRDATTTRNAATHVAAIDAGGREKLLAANALRLQP